MRVIEFAVAVACWYEVVAEEGEMMSILAFLKAYREVLDEKEGYRRKYLEIDKARGTTRRMHNYCCSHGLGDIPDLDRVWMRSRKSL